MDIKQFVWEAVDSNSWLLTEGEHGLLIDAVDSNELFNSISELKSLTVILTHSHFDHIIGLNRIREMKPETTVISTPNCSDNIGNKHRNMSSIADAFIAFYHNGDKKDYKISPFACESTTVTFESKYDFCWCKHKVKLDAVHGHSNDGLVAVIDNKKLFSGDTLLSMPTVTRFPGGDSRKFRLEDVGLLESMSNIEIVYPGHGNPGKKDDMMRINNIEREDN